jgi:O-antigen/teichoic acid export membrane protein
VPIAARLRPLLGGAVVAGGIALMNVTTYGLTIVMARWLGPAQFGQFSSILGLLIVVNVVSLGLQATAARRVARNPDDRAAIEATIIRAGRVSALAVGGAGVLLAPVVTRVLRLDTGVSAALMAVTAGLLCLMGAQVGILQGEQRWVSVSSVYAAMGVGRLALGGVGVLLERSTLGAMAGVAAGAVVPILVGWVALRHPSRTSPTSSAVAALQDTPERGSVAREVVHSSHALLAFFALTNVDIVLARVVLDDRHAGLYAAGLVVTKAVLFLPQFVVVVAFPAMARSGGGRRTQLVGLAVVLAVGTTATMLVAALPGPALAFVGGPQYVEMAPRLWWFAVLGTVLCLVQVLVYGGLAQHRTGLVWWVWAALVAMVSGFGVVHSVAGLLALKLTVDLVLVLAIASFVLSRSAASRTPVVQLPAPRLPSSVSRCVPGLADPDADVERHVHRHGSTHLTADERLERLPLPRRDLEDELVVDLEQHP